MMKITNVNRIKKYAVVLSILILFGLYMSSYLDALELYHDCTGEDCPICLMLEQSVNVIRQLGNAICITAIVDVFYLLFESVRNYASHPVVFKTLVDCKIRMDN